MRYVSLLALSICLNGCAMTQPLAPAEAFAANLRQLCGKSFPGRVATTDPADKDMAEQKLVMGPVACSNEGVSIPFAVGDNRSRNWHITRTTAGLRLKHVHTHEDGSEDKVSRYGGDTVDAGTTTRQEFPADQFSKDLFLANKLERSVTNVWAVEIVPGQMFAYELRRPNRFFRVEFALAPM